LVGVIKMLLAHCYQQFKLNYLTDEDETLTNNWLR